MWAAAFGCESAIISAARLQLFQRAGQNRLHGPKSPPPPLHLPSSPVPKPPPSWELWGWACVFFTVEDGRQGADPKVVEGQGGERRLTEGGGRLV